MGATWARHGHGMGTAWARHGHGMGTAWARHAICESAFTHSVSSPVRVADGLPLRWSSSPSFLPSENITKSLLAGRRDELRVTTYCSEAAAIAQSV
jgi:hypothetical protein